MTIPYQREPKVSLDPCRTALLDVLWMFLLFGLKLGCNQIWKCNASLEPRRLWPNAWKKGFKLYNMLNPKITNENGTPTVIENAMASSKMFIDMPFPAIWSFFGGELFGGATVFGSLLNPRISEFTTWLILKYVFQPPKSIPQSFWTPKPWKRCFNPYKIWLIIPKNCGVLGSPWMLHEC